MAIDVLKKFGPEGYAVLYNFFLTADIDRDQKVFDIFLFRAASFDVLRKVSSEQRLQSVLGAFLALDDGLVAIFHKLLRDPDIDRLTFKHVYIQGVLLPKFLCVQDYFTFMLDLLLDLLLQAFDPQQQATAERHFGCQNTIKILRATVSSIDKCMVFPYSITEKIGKFWELDAAVGLRSEVGQLLVELGCRTKYFHPKVTQSMFQTVLAAKTHPEKVVDAVRELAEFYTEKYLQHGISKLL